MMNYRDMLEKYAAEYLAEINSPHSAPIPMDDFNDWFDTPEEAVRKALKGRHISGGAFDIDADCFVFDCYGNIVSLFASEAADYYRDVIYEDAFREWCAESGKPDSA